MELAIDKILKAPSLFTLLETKLFGNSYVNIGSMLSIGISDRLRGLKSEPSMYGFALFIFFGLAISLYIKDHRIEYAVYATMALGLMILSMSFSAIVCLLGIIIFGVLKKYKESKRGTKILILLGVIVILKIFAAYLIKIYLYT